MNLCFPSHLAGCAWPASQLKHRSRRKTSPQVFSEASQPGCIPLRWFSSAVLLSKDSCSHTWGQALLSADLHTLQLLYSAALSRPVQGGALQISSPQAHPKTNPEQIMAEFLFSSFSANIRAAWGQLLLQSFTSQEQSRRLPIHIPSKAQKTILLCLCFTSSCKQSWQCQESPPL